MPDLTVRMFGPVSVMATSAGTQSMISLGRSAQMLLCWLALYAPQAVPREVVAAGLWPDADPDKARSCLSTALWRLKRPLEQAGLAQALTGADACLGLETPAPDAVDARQFSAMAASFLDKPGEAAWAVLTDLRSRGALMAGCYAVWALSARVRLDDLWERCLAVRLDWATARGDQAAVQAAATALLEIDPLDEDAHRALIRLYLAQGRRGHAQRQYQRCAAALRQDLNVDPAPETRALAADLGQFTGGPEQPVTPRDSDIRDLRRMLAQTQSTLSRLSDRLDGFLTR